jgi:hypothetical protein
MTERSLRAKAAQIFLKAASYIRNYGWQVEGMSEDGKPRCSMGALESAYQKEVWENDLSSLMYKSLYRQLNGISLTEFNHSMNDGVEVAKLFERTALTLAK